MIKILFTGGGGSGSEAIYRLLHKQYELHFADADPLSISPTIPIECQHKIPMAVDQNFTNVINELYNELSIDILVPGVDEELLKISDLTSVVSLLPQRKYVETMLDKLKCSRILEVQGQQYPVTEIATNINKNSNNIAYPCIAKPRSGRGSRNVNVIHSYEQLQAYLTLTGLSGHDVVVQELLIGQEYTVLMSADKNMNLQAIVPVRVDMKRGITIRAQSHINDIVINECSAIHNAIPAKGCYNIQLIHTDDGRVVPFEINPRVSTTFCLGLASGINPIKNFLDSRNTNQLLDFKNAIKLQRTWINNFYD
ncbi:ATP-grasp domain-containing protein [Candidatus Woesearchaeota archaeon]|jgi:carbamoyl-phosphate synthase large subunit|nr:ATP-grasp domain-containing protein [Candidatus Woesearchaeota archaeon]